LPADSSMTLPLKQLAWLNLATEALEKGDAEPNSLFDIAAEAWKAWLESDDANENLPLIIPISQFLESYYLKQEKWSACISVNERVISMYQEKEVWPKYIQAAKVLAFCHFKLDKKSEGLTYENEILSLPPFDKFMPGYKEQLTLEIISSRISHGLIAKAQELLNSLESVTENDQMKLAITNLQADIFLKQERYQEAIPLLEKMRSTYSEQGHNEAAEAIEKQIQSVREMLVETG